LRPNAGPFEDNPRLFDTSVLAEILCALIISRRRARGWNLLAISEIWAASRGVRGPRVMRTVHEAGSILVGGSIARTGPVGFADLTFPILVRRKISSDYRILLPSALFFGGTLLAVCKTLGRILIAPAEIPAGAMLALIGGSYLLWAMRQRKPLEEV
jgi:iron complex transport system permease protein